MFCAKRSGTNRQGLKAPALYDRPKETEYDACLSDSVPNPL